MAIQTSKYDSSWRTVSAPNISYNADLMQTSNNSTNFCGRAYSLLRENVVGTTISAIKSIWNRTKALPVSAYNFSTHQGGKFLGFILENRKILVISGLSLTAIAVLHRINNQVPKGAPKTPLVNDSFTTYQPNNGYE